MTPQTENPEQQAKRVSVVIVSFNRAESLRRSLTAVGAAHQVLVVDNGSNDGTGLLASEFPHVRFIPLPKNFGFTKALNIGVRAAEGEFLLILDDDTIIEEATVSKLADILAERQDAGAVSPRFVTDTGAPAPQVREMPAPAVPDPPFRPADGETAICVSGAILFRLSFLRALRQIDERYGNYGSIPELCWQVRQANRKLLIPRDVTAVHEGLRSPMKAGALAGDRAVGTAVFLGKHYGFMAGILYRIKAAIGALATFRFSVIAGALSNVKIDGG